MNNYLRDVENKEEEQRLLVEYNNREDLFDVFVRTLLANAPSVYVFINLTLLIWIGQTIFNSNLDPIPRSLYLLTPYFTSPPFFNIILAPSQSSCPENTHRLALKTFPTINKNQIPHQYLYDWDDPPFEFCLQLLSNSSRSSSCPDHLIQCSGYCTDTLEHCPITNIRVSQDPSLQNGYQQFHQQNGKYYQLTRNEGIPLVSLAVVYTPMCANDQHFTQTFQNETLYWQTVQNCKEEGTVQSFFNIVDQIQINSFLNNNLIPLTNTDSQLQSAFLGTVREFTFSENDKEGCANAHQQALDIQTSLKTDLIAPQFTESLLIISFILLVSELIWLLAYYCFGGMALQKNLIVVMLSVIEVVVIGFIYSENWSLFQVQQMANSLAKCLKQQLPALKSWHFGIDSPQVFQMVLFVNTAFLALYLLALLLHRFVFEQYIKLEVKLPKNNIRKSR